MRHAWPLIALAATLTLPLGAAALTPGPDTTPSVLRARDTADLPAAGQWSVGVFNPLEIGLRDGLSIQTHPLLIVASPNATLRYRTGTVAGWRVTSELGLSLPRLGMTQPLPVGVAGWLTPACKVTAHDPTQASSCDQAGWILVPTLGGVASTGTRHVWTARVEIAMGIPLSGELGRPLQAHAPLDLLFAPATYGMRTRIGLRYDHALNDRIRVSGEANAYLLGDHEARSRFIGTAHVGVDIAVGARNRFTVGVLYANQDQGADKVEVVDGFGVRSHVRSNDFYPTFDFVWGW